MATTTANINGWVITTVSDETGLEKRWFTLSCRWSILIYQENYDSQYYYRCIIKTDDASNQLANKIGDTPLEAYRAARRELNRIRDLLSGLR